MYLVVFGFHCAAFQCVPHFGGLTSQQFSHGRRTNCVHHQARTWHRHLLLADFRHVGLPTIFLIRRFGPRKTSNTGTDKIVHTFVVDAEGYHLYTRCLDMQSHIWHTDPDPKIQSFGCHQLAFPLPQSSPLYYYFHFESPRSVPSS